MLTNNVELRVLIKGKPIVEYLHRGQTYVEGRAGSAYEIEFRNRNAFRAEVILTVDGLSVLDGKAALPTSRGYVVEPNSTLRVPGWKVDADTAAAFEFAGKKQSYATEMSGGDARNNGVIGAMVFREQERATTSVFPYAGYHNRPAVPFSGYMTTTGVARSFDPGTLYGVTLGANGGGQASSWTFSDQAVALGVAATALDATLRNATDSTLIGSSVVQNMMVNACAPVGAATIGSFAGTATSQGTTSFEPAAPVEQSLGTGFGEATDFTTQAVSFERGDLLAVMELYYDEARALRQRGIEVGRRAEKFAQHQPQAFPMMAQAGCTPPVGWKPRAR